MADNTVLNAGAGGDTAATDDIGGVKYQRVKPNLGADGTAVDAIPVVAGLDTTATGVQAVGLVAQLDDAATAAVTEDQFAPVRLSSRRALLVEGVASGTAVPVSGTVAVSSVTTSVTPGTSAGHLGKAEDAASASGDTGVMILGVRNATPTDQSAGNTDGDYEPLQVSASGRLWCAALIDTSVTPGTSASHLGKAEDAAAASGDTGVAALAIQLATPADTAGTDGDYAMLQMSAGRLWGSVKVDTALPAGTNAIGKLASNSGVTIGAIEVAAAQTIAVTNAGTFAVQAAPTTAASWGIYVEDAGETAAGNLMMAGSVRRDTLASSAGTTGDNATINTDANGAVWVRHNDAIAHDAADAGNGIKLAGKAETSPKGITLVADGDRSDLYCDADGILLAKLGTAWGDLINERVSNTDGASTAFSTFSAVASTRNYVTAITVHNAHATTNGFVDLRDGTAGAVLWTFPLPATGGTTINFNPPLRQPTANTALAFDVSAAITTVYLSVNGFQSKV